MIYVLHNPRKIPIENIADILGEKYTNSPYGFISKDKCFSKNFIDIIALFDAYLEKVKEPFSFSKYVNFLDKDSLKLYLQSPLGIYKPKYNFVRIRLKNGDIIDAGIAKTGYNSYFYELYTKIYYTNVRIDIDEIEICNEDLIKE